MPTSRSAPTDPSNGQPPAAASRSSYTRFAEDECVILCRAFVNISEDPDPITGTDQKQKVFWARIAEKFKEICSREGITTVGRMKSAKSLKSKWKKSIVVDVNHYLGVYKTTPMASGENEEDHEKRILEVFKDRYEKSFSYENCLPVLKKMPKFNMVLEGGGKIPVDMWVNAGVYSAVTTPRPPGTKTAKRVIDEEKASADRDEKKMKMLDSLVQHGEKIALSLKSEAYFRIAEYYGKKGQHNQEHAFLMKAVALASGVDTSSTEHSALASNDNAQEDNTSALAGNGNAQDEDNASGSVELLGSVPASIDVDDGSSSNSNGGDSDDEL